MFVLTIIKDEIRVHPSRFGEALLDSLVEEIDSKYANRVSAAACVTGTRAAAGQSCRIVAADRA